MINPNPKIDLSEQNFSSNPIENKIMNSEYQQEMYELSRKRAEFLTTCTEKEFNEYKALREK